MASGGHVRKLLEQLLPCLYSFYVPNPAGPVTAKTFVPVLRLKYGLFEKLKHVLMVEKIMVHKKWEKFVDISFVKMLMLSSHEMYLRHVIFACRYFIDHIHHEQVFSIFLCLCALVINFGIETFKCTGINYCELSTDIVMAVYANDLNEMFLRCGGIRQFKAFVLSFKSLFMDAEWIDLSSPETTRAFEELVTLDFINNQTTARNGVVFYPERITQEEIMSCNFSQSLAKTVLESTKVALPSLPSADELKARVRAAMQKKRVKSVETESVLDGVLKKEKAYLVRVAEKPCGEKQEDKFMELLGSFGGSLLQCGNSSSDSKTDNVVEQEENIAWFENVVQAITEHNLNRPAPNIQLNPVQRDVIEVICKLKSNIQSLIDVLDKCDN